MQRLAQCRSPLRFIPILRVFNAILIWLSPRQRIVGFCQSAKFMQQRMPASLILVRSVCRVPMVGASRLDRCCNKPVVSAASLAIGTDSLHANSNRPDIAIVCLRFSYSFLIDYMSAWLLPLRGAFLSAKVSSLRQLTLVHKKFLERGQEVSLDFAFVGRRNFS